jgi:hypothetical protein
MIHNITINPKLYQTREPYPYCIQDGILDKEYAKALQNEILQLPKEVWDRYNNPFEQKWTLRDKFNFPPLLRQLFEELQSQSFIKQLELISGWNLQLDTNRNFWGVHVYEPGDYLDIHIDAGRHPTLGLKKQVTLGIYLSANWLDEYGCKLEIWKGTSAASEKPEISECVESIAPLFNRLVLFNCNDVSWHGNPEPACGPAEAKRIFITISYLSDNTIDQNKKVKALFVARPQDVPNPEKDALRLLRADPERYKDIYNTIIK